MKAFAIYGTSSTQGSLVDIYIDNNLLYENYEIKSDFNIPNNKIFEYKFDNKAKHTIKIVNKSENPLVIDYFGFNLHHYEQ
ncbi:UNVERIFIED_CONTAM: hypothetical protein O8I53_13875 [Campylobacter lari]